ncbi:MAG: hypothetical protein SynsKO_08410 [Synoicihabitans sp.]
MSETPIERLEERIAWLERHLLEQDKVMMSQGDEIAKLKEGIISLRERISSRETPLDPNERPPHY